MKQKPDNQQLLLRYLLGELSDDEQTRLEVSYMADDGLFEELLAAEDGLIDSYAQNEFSEHERKRIEKHFLRLPTRGEKVKFIRMLMQYSAKHSLSEQPEGTKLKRRLSWWHDLMSFFKIRV